MQIECHVCHTKINRSPSQIKGKKFQYCSRKCQSEHYKTRYKDSNNPSWKGGKIFTDQGYIRTRMPEHPRAVGGYVLEHILVMEKKLGRSLEKGERVHHIDGDGANNDPDNLTLYKSNSEHMQAHAKERKPSLCKCGRKVKGHDLCFRHLAQLRRTGTTWDYENDYLRQGQPGDDRIYSSQKDKKCPCGDTIKCKGLCSKHYQYWRNHGKLPIFDTSDNKTNNKI